MSPSEQKGGRGDEDKAVKHTAARRTYSSLQLYRLPRFESQKRCPKAYNCIDCPFSTNFPVEMRRHTERHKDFTCLCKECNMPFRSKSALSHHEHQAHGVEPVYRGPRRQCEQCPYSTHHSSDLARHRRKHKNTAYECEYCRFPFASFSMRMAHIRQVHSSEGARKDPFYNQWSRVDSQDQEQQGRKRRRRRKKVGTEKSKETKDDHQKVFSKAGSRTLENSDIDTREKWQDRNLNAVRNAHNNETHSSRRIRMDENEMLKVRADNDHFQDQHKKPKKPIREKNKIKDNGENGVGEKNEQSLKRNNSLGKMKINKEKKKHSHDNIPATGRYSHARVSCSSRPEPSDSEDSLASIEDVDVDCFSHPDNFPISDHPPGDRRLGNDLDEKGSVKHMIHGDMYGEPEHAKFANKRLVGTPNGQVHGFGIDKETDSVTGELGGASEDEDQAEEDNVDMAIGDESDVEPQTEENQDQETGCVENGKDSELESEDEFGNELGRVCIEDLEAEYETMTVMLEDGSTAEAFRCTRCVFFTTDQDTFSGHIDTHRRGHYSCTHCRMPFHERTSLEKHMKQKHDSDSDDSSRKTSPDSSGDAEGLTVPPECSKDSDTDKITRHRKDEKCHKANDTKRCTRKQIEQNGHTHQQVHYKNTSMISKQQKRKLKPLLKELGRLDKDSFKQTKKLYSRVYRDGDWTYECLVCEEDNTFSSARAIWLHFRKLHRKLRRRVCSSCPYCSGPFPTKHG